jgi:bla regulator protein blaR1
VLTWMVYVFVITLLLSGAALAAEHVARLRRARTRWIWAAAIAASLLIPTLIASVSIQVPSFSTPAVSPKAVPLRDLTSVQLVPLTWVHQHTGNVVATHSENRVLQRAWLIVSVALLAALILNGLQVAWRKRGWRTGTVAGLSVYIGRDVGPAVVGLLRPRIVVPDWLLEAAPSHQAMVITHEQSHLAGRDPQLLTAALFLLVLMPWNLPLWWQLHRLRYAIEVDCDARVLKAGLDARQYGEALIDVSQRPSGYIGSVAAMSESRSFLEERITIMVRDPARWGSLLTVMFGCASVALLAVAAQVSPPNIGSLDSEQGVSNAAPQLLEGYVGLYLRGENIIFEITREGGQLFMQAYGVPDVKLVAEKNGSFGLGRSGGMPVTFVQDAAGRATALVLHYDTPVAPFSVLLPRIDAATAQAVNANNARRARSQTPIPGSEAALQRLIDGILRGQPRYEEMAAGYGKILRQAWPVTRATYAKRGAVRSITFRRVDRMGGDVYEVTQESGTSLWTIFMDSNGLIADADDFPGW